MELQCPACKSFRFPVLVRYAADLMICKDCGQPHPGATVHAYREELTPAGLQLCIPGTERIPPKTGKPAQLSLFP